MGKYHLSTYQQGDEELGLWSGREDSFGNRKQHVQRPGGERTRCSEACQLLGYSDKLIKDHRSSPSAAWSKPSGTNNSLSCRGERLLLNSRNHRSGWKAA